MYNHVPKLSRNTGSSFRFNKTADDALIPFNYLQLPLSTLSPTSATAIFPPVVSANLKAWLIVSVTTTSDGPKLPTGEPGTDRLLMFLAESRPLLSGGDDVRPIV
jgi:hypothetical protein